MKFALKNLNKSRTISRFAMALALTAWIVPTVNAAPKVAHHNEVKSCHYLGHVNGHSKHSKHHDWKPSAKAAALSHAKKKGATHIVWERFTPIGAFNGVAVANAYSCHHHHHRHHPHSTAQ